MSFERVKNYLAPFGLADRCIDLKDSSATVALAAQALGTEEARIAKTMSFLLDDTPLIVVVAGDARVDNHKFKETFHKKAKMIPGADCEKYIGHRPGGVCPFDLPDTVPGCVHETFRHRISGGRHGPQRREADSGGAGKSIPVQGMGGCVQELGIKGKGEAYDC